MKNIILLGLPGSGKTTIGKLLAQKINYDFLDVDDLVPQQIKDKNKNQELVKDEEWLMFIKQTAKTIDELKDRTVIAHILVKKEYLELFDAEFFYLDAPPDILEERLTKRKDHFFTKELLQEIASEQEELDVIQIDANNGPELVVQEIGVHINQT